MGQVPPVNSDFIMSVPLETAVIGMPRPKPKNGKSTFDLNLLTAEALKEIISGHGSAPEPTEDIVQARKTKWWVLIVVNLFAVALLLTFVRFRRKPLGNGGDSL